MKHSQPPHGALDLRTSLALSRLYDDVWDEIEPRTSELSRARVKEAVANAIIAITMAGQRRPDQIFAYALSRAREALD